MDIPSPGMIRNPGLHFDRTLDQPGWGGGLLPALYPELWVLPKCFDILSISLFGGRPRRFRSAPVVPAPMNGSRTVAGIGFSSPHSQDGRQPTTRETNRSPG